MVIGRFILVALNRKSIHVAQVASSFKNQWVSDVTPVKVVKRVALLDNDGSVG